MTTCASGRYSFGFVSVAAWTWVSSGDLEVEGEERHGEGGVDDNPVQIAAHFEILLGLLSDADGERGALE
jgi:hypothetical protein